VRPILPPLKASSTEQGHLTGSQGTIALAFDPVYNRSASLARVSGTWSFDGGMDTTTLTADGHGFYPPHKPDSHSKTFTRKWENSSALSYKASCSRRSLG
jgi:hypothetical protein